MKVAGENTSYLGYIWVQGRSYCLWFIFRLLRSDRTKIVSQDREFEVSTFQESFNSENFCEDSNFLICGGQNCRVPASVSPILLLYLNNQNLGFIRCHRRSSHKDVCPLISQRFPVRDWTVHVPSLLAVSPDDIVTGYEITVCLKGLTSLRDAGEYFHYLLFHSL